MKNSASGGARWVDVAPERFPGWVASFARRHGADTEAQSLTVAVTGDTVIFTAPDGAVAECHPPFPPLADNSKKRAAAEAARPAEAAEVVEAARRPRWPRRSPRTRGDRAPLACSSSGSAATPPACSPAIRRPWPTPRPGPAWCTAAARPAAGRSTVSRGGARSRQARRCRRPPARRPTCSGAGAAGRPTGRNAGRGRARRGQAGDGGIAAGPEAGALPGDRDRQVPHRSRSEAGGPRGHAAAVPRRANKAYGADTLIRYPETS